MMKESVLNSRSVILLQAESTLSVVSSPKFCRSRRAANAADAGGWWWGGIEGNHRSDSVVHLKDAMVADHPLSPRPASLTLFSPFASSLPSFSPKMGH